MLKSLLFTLLLFAATASADVLRIGDATNGAPLRQIQFHAMELALSGGHDISMKRFAPSDAVNALKKNAIDLLIIEKRFLKDIPSGFQQFPYAAEALCLYVHSDNPVGSISPQEITDILTSVRPRWNSYTRLSSADIQRIMLKPGTSGIKLLRRSFGELIPDREIMQVSNIEGLFIFINNPAALGFAPFYPDYPREIALLPVNNIAPSTQTLKTGTYPLTRQYVLLCAGQPSGILLRFINTLRSLDERRKLPEYGMIPLWEVTP